jgi:succinate-semialdehyde dehydrogenase/glutarate-semialdehyde dehydrogenase
MAQSAQHIKRLSLELGGNAPFIIFEDADLDAACTGLMMAKFRNAGQTCVSANRIYVQHNIKAKLIEKLLPRIQELKTGSGFDHQTSLGPLIDNSALEKVNRHIQSALDEGAVLLSGGIASSAQTCEATLLDLVPHESAFLKEETFGPVCPIISFETEDQVVDQANATDAGLVAYFYSQNQRQCTRVSEALDFGMIGINEGLISNAVAPFGGVKASGLGREGSMAGLDEYLELKYTCSSV